MVGLGLNSGISKAEGDGGGGGAAPSISSPSDILALEVWLDGDDVTANGSNQIGIWTDKSGNGNDGIQTNNNDKPTTGNTRNSNAVTTWDGSDDMYFTDTGFTIGDLNLYAHPDAGSWTVFVSFKATANSGNVLAKADGPAGDRVFALAYGTGNVQLYLRGTNTTLASVALGEWVAVVVEYDHIRQKAYYRINGGPRTSISIGNNPDEATFTRIGARTDGETFPFTGDIGNIIGFTKVLAKPEMDFMQTYQSERWDIPFENVITLSSSDFGDTASDVPIRIRKDNYTPNEAWAGNGHFKLSDDSVPKQRTNITPIIQNDCIWTWFNRPEAVYANGYTFITWFSFNEDDWYIGRYEHSTKKWMTKNLGNDGSAQQNDHNNPTVVIDEDGIINVFAGEHNSTDARHFRSDTAYDISSFTTVVLSGFGNDITYTQAQLMAGNTIAYTFRDITSASERPRKLALYDVDLDSWSAEKTLVEVSNERPYMHIIVDPNDDDKLHVVYTLAHPREITQGTNDIFHGFYRISTDSIYKTDGTLIGAISSNAFNGSNGTLIEDATTRGFNFWSADISICADGNPAVVYSEHDDQEAMYYRYAKWDGTSWNPQPIVFAGQSIYGVYDGNAEPQYIPGLCMADDGTTVFYSRDTSVGGKLQVFKATTSDNGVSWTETRISAEGGREMIRPVAVRGAQSDLQCLYLTGNFTEFTDMKMDMACYPATAAQSFHIDSILEVDTDGTDIVLDFTNDSATLDGAFTDEITFIDSETSLRKLTGTDTVISGRTNFTVVAAGNADVISSSSNVNFVVSDWKSTSSAESMLIRIDHSTDGIDFFVQGTSKTGSINAISDATISEDVDFGIAAKLEAGTMKVAANGTLSATTDTGVGDVQTKSGGEDFRSGTSPHNNDLWNGEIYAIGFYSTAKTDDWMKMASKGLQGYTW